MYNAERLSDLARGPFPTTPFARACVGNASLSRCEFDMCPGAGENVGQRIGRGTISPALVDEWSLEATDAASRSRPQ